MSRVKLHRQWLRLLLVAGCALFPGFAAMAGTVSGTVTGPGGIPIPGATVIIENIFKGGRTDASGQFSIPDVPPGEHSVSIGSMMLTDQHVTVSVPASGAATELAIQLEPNHEMQRAAAAYTPPVPAHLAQKRDYLAGLAPAGDAERPNIVVILFDDLGFGDLTSYGNRLIDTPQIDQWGDAGMRLESFYSASPVCTPSRAGLLTGRYPTRSHAANHVFFPQQHFMAMIRAASGFANALPRDEIMIPEMLQRAGYATGAFGKWHLGDAPGHRPNDFGFDRYYGVLYSNDMQPLDMWSDTEIAIPAGDNRQEDLTRHIADAAIDFIRAHKDRRFFAYIPFTAPHLPIVPADDYRGISDGGTYGDVIEDLDRNVGRIRDALAQLDLDDNTLVIITSDNGANWGGSAGALRGRKSETFDGGQRVPAFAIWPGHIAPGSSSDAMAMNIDLLPTFAALAGLELPTDRLIDGRDMAPILWGDGNSPHDFLYYVTSLSGEYQAVRDARFKFRDVIAQKSPLNPVGAVEFYDAIPSLYDLSQDNEAHDVTARHPKERERLEGQLEKWRAEIAANPRGWRDPSPQE